MAASQCRGGRGEGKRDARWEPRADIGGIIHEAVLTRRRVVGTGARASSVSPGFGTKGKARSCSVVMKGLPETLFTIGTVAVLPLYGAMIGAPKAEDTKRDACRSC